MSTVESRSVQGTAADDDDAALAAAAIVVEVAQSGCREVGVGIGRMLARDGEAYGQCRMDFPRIDLGSRRVHSGYTALVGCGEHWT